MSESRGAIISVRRGDFIGIRIARDAGVAFGQYYLAQARLA
jgi:hypothetical protein